MNKSASVLGVAMLASLASAQQIIVPDLQAFSATGSSTAIFRLNAQRIQVAYDSTLFTTCGVTGPITINRLRFRLQDQQRNPCGQTYAGVTVEVGNAAVDHAALTTTFATNRGTMGALGTIATLTVGASRGSVPNTYNVDIDLVAIGASVSYDPSTGTDLLIDITMPSEPTGGIANGGGTASGVPTATLTPAAGHTAVLPSPFNRIRFTSGANLGLSRTVGTISAGISISHDAFPVISAPGDTFDIERVLLHGFATSSATTHLSRRLTANLPGLTTPTLSAFGPACLIDFTGGPGGYPAVRESRSESIGAGCGDAASFYQLFPTTEPFDLRSTSLTLTPNVAGAPTTYSVTAGAIAPDLSPAALGGGLPNTSDDTNSSHAMGWSFLFPGGSTADLTACPNGYVHLAAAAPSGDFSPSVIEFLGNTVGVPYPAMLAPFWHDFHAGLNLPTSPTSGMYVNTDTTGGPGAAVTYVTWLDIGEFNTLTASQPAASGFSVNTFQCVLFETSNVVQFRYGAMGAYFGNGITGFSRGRVGGVNSVDSLSRNLSHEVPFATMPEGIQAALGHGVTPAGTRPNMKRLVPAQTFSLTGFNHRPATAFGAMIFDFVAVEPGVNFTPLAAGCILTTSMTPFTLQLFTAPTGTVTTAAPLTMPMSVPALFWMGVPFYTQYVTMNSDGSVSTSNAIRHTLGLQ